MTTFPCLVRTASLTGEDRYLLGHPVVDRYLEFVAGRLRPNTLRAVAFDLKTFFSVDRQGAGRGGRGRRLRVPGPPAGRPHA